MLLAVVFMAVVTTATSSDCCRYDCPCGCGGLPVKPLPVLSLKEAYEDQPYYVVLVPDLPAYCDIDNICFTSLPVAQGCDILESVVSTVFFDGSYNLSSRLVTMDTLGIFRTASPDCTYHDTVFAILNYEECGCEIYILSLNVICGECPRELPMPVYGLSTQRTTLSEGCLLLVNVELSLYQLPPVTLTTLPNSLDSQCYS